MRNFTTVKDQIIKIVEPILKESGLKIYEINNYFDFDSDILQILVEDLAKPNKPLDFDDITKSNELISQALDQLEELSDAYMLEIASAGAEKPIKDKDQLIKAIGDYIHLELNKSVNNQNTIEGTLLSYDEVNDSFILGYFLKGQKKKHNFTFNEVKSIRYAVKF
ncbi:ribosome maturation factor RimP [Mesoplasma corruscae]|uniref:Ribosome maturation factor RimP n=1 Tax=Mesoplasma corruscae TaxID=216874 RepID=A0A2S5RGC3_9MOLU|nr:ribosome maturation factor RimP [Mesoplasma corruscae]PPE06384.1 ribosome maturation factor RimP [Mesoplasma corruscae]